MEAASIVLNFDPKALASQVFEQQAQLYFSALPKPDPQFTCEEVAGMLACDVTTVRAYLKLPAAHPRHLPHVQVSDGPKGRRIRLSAISAWQERNDAQALASASLQLIPPKRPARRRLVA